MNFNVTPIMRGLWEITDGTAESPCFVDIYLVEGNDKALVIDAGVSGADLSDCIRTLTKKPTELVLTDGDHDGVYTKTGISLTISVMDKHGDAVKGATVVLDGSNILTSSGKQVHGTTDDMGKVTFSGLSASQTGKSVGFVSVSVTKSDLGTDNSLTIPVISE
jgi:hypothetical protein